MRDLAQILTSPRAPAIERPTPVRSRSFPLVEWALAGLFIVIRAWNLRSFCLDMDEVFGVTSASLPLDRMLAAVANDLVHPPLWYFVLKCWIAVGGTSLGWLRLLPFAISCAALVPLFALLRRLEIGRPARLLALALLAVSEYQVYHSQYVRMYSLLFLLSLTSLVLFLRWTSSGRRRDLALLAAVDLLAVYTHYYGWALVGTEGLALVLWARRRVKAFAIGAAAVALAFAPWVATVVRATGMKGDIQRNLGWIEHPGIHHFFWFYAGLSGPLAPFYIACAMVPVWAVFFAAGIRKAFRRAAFNGHGRDLRFIALFAFLPPAVAFLASATLKDSVWGSRHLILSAAPFAILLALALVELRLRRIALATLTVWLAWGACRVTFSPAPRLNMEVLAREFAARNAGPVTVYALDRHVPAWMRYHLPRGAQCSFVIIRDRRRIDAIAGDDFWVEYNRKLMNSPEKRFRARGYAVTDAIWAGDEWDRVILFRVRRITPAQIAGSKRL